MKKTKKQTTPRSILSKQRIEGKELSSYPSPNKQKPSPLELEVVTHHDLDLGELPFLMARWCSAPGLRFQRPAWNPCDRHWNHAVPLFGIYLTYIHPVRLYLENTAHPTSCLHPAQPSFRNFLGANPSLQATVMIDLVAAIYCVKTWANKTTFLTSQWDTERTNQNLSAALCVLIRATCHPVPWRNLSQHWGITSQPLEDLHLWARTTDWKDWKNMVLAAEACGFARYFAQKYRHSNKCLTAARTFLASWAKTCISTMVIYVQHHI